MIKWVWFESHGHAVVDLDTGEQGTTAYGACDVIVPVDDGTDVREAAAVTERPFGVDTCRVCHNAGKRWAIAPAELPEYARIAAADQPAPKRMSAADRKAALAGGQSQPVSMPAPAAPAAQPRAAVPGTPAPEPGSDDDLGFEPSGPSGGPQVYGGATLVVPGSPRRRSSRDAADVDIDSE